MGKGDELLLSPSTSMTGGDLKSVSKVVRSYDEVRGKRQVNFNRKVQWNDDKGNRLVEVFEFEPRLVQF